MARSHKSRSNTLISALVITVTLAGCSTTSPSKSNIAPSATVVAGRVAPIALEHAGGPAGQDVLAPTTEVSVLTVPDTLQSTTSPALPSSSIEASTLPTIPPTIAAPPQTSVVVRTVPPTQPPTVATFAPKTAPKTTRRRRVTTVRSTASPTVAVPVDATATTLAAVPTTASSAAPKRTTLPKAPAAKAPGAACTAKQNGEQRPSTKKPNVVQCSKAKGVWRWRTLASASSADVARAGGAPAVVAGFDGSTINLAIIGTKTNPTWSNISRAITAAFEARIATINRRGGIGGRYRVNLIVRDANYDPVLTLAEVNATKGQVVGYGSILGTPATDAVLDLLRQEGLLASPASQEARWANEAALLPVFNSYQIQAINAVSYYLETKPGSTICSVSVAGTFGDAGKEGVTFAAQDLGAKLGTALTLAPTDTNVTPVLGQLRAAGCQGVMATVTPQQLAALVIGSARAGITFQWMAMGASFSDRLITSQTSLVFEQTCWVVGDGPVWGEGTGELSNELIASNNKYWTENPDIGLTFGYVQARVWEAVLERAVARKDLSRAGLLIASREIGTVDLGGVGSPTDYSQPQRLSAPRASIFSVDGSYRNSVKMLKANYSSPTAAKYRR